MMKNRKAATNTVLVVGYVVIAISVGVFMWQSYDMLIEMQVAADAETTSKDIGTLTEATYAAPEEVYVDYTPTKDMYGFSSVGSLLVNSEESRIYTHPYSQPEIWGQIQNNALSAWGLGVAARSVNKLRKMKYEYSQRKIQNGLNKILYDMNKEKIDNLLTDKYKAAGLPEIMDNKKTRDGVLTMLDSDTRNMFLGAPPSLLDDLNPKTANELRRVVERSSPSLFTKSTRRWSKELEFSGLSGETKNWLKSDEGVDFLKSLKEDPGSRQWLNSLNKMDDVQVDNIKTLLKNEQFLKDLRLVDGAMDGTDFAKLIGTYEGDLIVKAFAGKRLGRKPKLWATKKNIMSNRELKLIRRDMSSKYLRNIAGNPDEAAALSKYMDEHGDALSKIMSDRKRNVRNMLEKPKKAKKYGYGDDAVAALDDLQDLTKENKNIKEVMEATKYPEGKQFKKVLADGPDAFNNDVLKSSTWLDQFKDEKRAGEIRDAVGLSKWQEFKLGKKRKIAKRIAAIKDTKGMSKVIDKTGDAADWLKGTRAMRSSSKAISKIAKTWLGTGVKAGMATTSFLGPLDACAQTSCKAAWADMTGSQAAVCVACKATSWVVWVGFIAIDVATVTYPMWGMMYHGHKESKRIKNMDSHYEYINEKGETYVSPPDCEPTVHRSDIWKQLKEKETTAEPFTSPFTELADIDSFSVGAVWNVINTPLELIMAPFHYLGPIFGEMAMMFPNADCSQEIEEEVPAKYLARDKKEYGGRCMDAGGTCPNYYVASSSWPKFGPIDTRAFGTGRLAMSYVGGTTACAYIGAPRPFIGMLCYLGAYSGLFTSFIAFPDLVIPAFTGSNIYPLDEYWYAGFPDPVQVQTTYNATTGDKDVLITAE